MYIKRGFLFLEDITDTDEYLGLVAAVNNAPPVSAMRLDDPELNEAATKI